MYVICSQNAAGLAHKDDPTIIAWMHGDEPDNAQEKKGGGYGPPILPEKIVADYKKIREADPSIPMMCAEPAQGQRCLWIAIGTFRVDPSRPAWAAPRPRTPCRSPSPGRRSPSSGRRRT